jgi:hypothetical protein
MSVSECNIQRHEILSERNLLPAIKVRIIKKLVLLLPGKNKSQKKKKKKNRDNCPPSL